jgi:serine protease Do
MSDDLFNGNENQVNKVEPDLNGTQNQENKVAYNGSSTNYNDNQSNAVTENVNDNSRILNSNNMDSSMNNNVDSSNNNNLNNNVDSSSNSNFNFYAENSSNNNYSSNMNSNYSNTIDSDLNSNRNNNVNSNPNSNIGSDMNAGNIGNNGAPGQNNSTYSFWAEQVAASSPNQSGTAYQNGQYNNIYEDKQRFDPNNNNGNGYGNPGDNNRKKPRSFKFLKKAVKFVAGAAVFGAIAGVCFLGFNLAYYKINPEASPITFNIGGDSPFKLNLSTGNDQQIEATAVTQEGVKQRTDITDVVASTMPSIVTITTTYNQSFDWFGQQIDQPNEGGGSGIIVGKNDKELLIATNNHVVEGANPIKVKFIDGTEATAIIKGTDAVADLAVISIDISSIKEATLNAIKVAQLGDSGSVKVGEMAIAIGNALGYGQSTTVGYISAKDRKVELEDKTMVLLQTDAAINPGNSGGALLNLKGEVIGINTVKYASSEVEGMGFAIPISKATPIINELMTREILKDGEKGYLGVSIQDVTEDISKAYNWPVGVYVVEAVEGGSAAKAGIVTGDVITKVNDTEITAGTQLKEKVTSYRVGTEVTITVMRNSNGKFVEKKIKVQLGKNPDSK